MWYYVMFFAASPVRGFAPAWQSSLSSIYSRLISGASGIDYPVASSLTFMFYMHLMARVEQLFVYARLFF